MKKQGYIYILSNKYNTTLYIGVTSDLIKRIYKHKNKFFDGFSKTYNTTKLVYFEVSDDMNSAIAREKVLKRWKRKWKDDLIKSFNPTYKDLYEEICGAGEDPATPDQIRGDDPHVIPHLMRDRINTNNKPNTDNPATPDQLRGDDLHCHFKEKS